MTMTCFRVNNQFATNHNIYKYDKSTDLQSACSFFNLTSEHIRTPENEHIFCQFNKNLEKEVFFLRINNKSWLRVIAQT